MNSFPTIFLISVVSTNLETLKLIHLIGIELKAALVRNVLRYVKNV